jgi:hypothetical protein
MRKRRIAIPMQAAAAFTQPKEPTWCKRSGQDSQENMDMKLTWCKVRGVDMMTPMMVVITEKTAVHNEWSDKVLRTLAPVRTWNPIRRMLFASSMNAEKT